ncbi:glucosyltransferase domain-containing protein [Pseudomonas sp. D3-10]|uniref:glucosyltransferase domain-containing protein n=1 Tax=Pseudomonas sp. D3-10 TaxID=2817392 RepID=UPI003DA7F53B
MSKKEVLVFFTIASFVYVFPFVHADYAYVDDNWRLFLLADDDWCNTGRVLIEVFVKFLTFNNATVNIFPFPLLVATFALALAMSRLTFLFFSRPDFTACLVVLPILCSPFFIGNITYQYDGPGMMLAVVAAIYAVTYSFGGGTFRRLLAALLVTATLSLYQLAISVYTGLCLIEFVWNIRSRRTANEILCALTQRGLQLMLGASVYYLTTFQMIDNSRGGLIFF